MRPAFHSFVLPLLLGAALGAGSCGSPSKPSETVDPNPTGPTVACPASPTPLTSATGQPVAFQYPTATSTGGAPPVAITCAPPSGSNFPVGSTTVTCTATDARQRSNACSFSIVVQSPPRISITSFLAFGDSLTWGEDGRDAGCGTLSTLSLRPECRLTGRTYPDVLTQQLRARYVGQSPTVANGGCRGEAAGVTSGLGICADTGTSALVRFSSVLSSGLFGAVLIMEGSNDLADRDSRAIDPAVSALRTMVQTAKSRNIRPFLATIPPMVPGGSRALAWSLVPAMNSGIRSVAASENITLVDVEAAFGTAYQQYIGFDGLHPNADGYAKIAETFFNTLKSTLETQGSTATSLSLATPRRTSR